MRRFLLGNKPKTDMKNSALNFTAKDIPTIATVCGASLLYSFGMNRFVKSGNLFPGGYAGVARLISEIALEYFHFNLSL